MIEGAFGGGVGLVVGNGTTTISESLLNNGTVVAEQKCSFTMKDNEHERRNNNRFSIVDRHLFDVKIVNKCRW